MKKIFTAISFIALFCTASMAQTGLRSAYFLDGYNYQHEFNPAMPAQRGYFSLPALGGFNVGMQSNMGVSTFLYPKGDNLVTFMHPSVSSGEFLGKLKDNNKLSVQFSMPIVTAGFWTKAGFFSIDINAKVNSQANLPKSLFEFMKNPGAAQHYDLGNLAIGADSYTEIAVGHAHRVTDRINVGGRIKLLVGVGSADIRMEGLQADMTEEAWSLRGQGTARVSAGFLNIPTKAESGKTGTAADNDVIDFDNIGTVDNMGADAFLNGYGVALDLGATWEVIDGLTLSGAITDLGFISYRNVTKAETSGEAWTFDGFDNASFDSGSENNIDDQFKGIGDDLEDMAQFHRTETGASSLEMLACNVNLSAEYELPFYRRLSVGLLSTLSIKGPYTWSEGRLYANLRPTDWFSLAANCACSSYGPSAGFALGFHCAGFSMFLGSDSLFFNMAKVSDDVTWIGVPYKNARANINFGISFNVGKRRSL